MENLSTGFKKVHQLFMLLIATSVLYTLLNGHYTISLLHILGYSEVTFLVYQGLWLGMLIVYMVFLWELRHFQFIKYGLLPFAVIAFVALTGMLFFGKNISDQEGIWFHVLFYAIAFPFHGHALWVHTCRKQATTFRYVLWGLIFLSGLATFIGFFDFWFNTTLYWGLLNFAVGISVFSLLLINTVLLLSLSILYVRHKVRTAQ
jgi:hypothetical protein